MSKHTPGPWEIETGRPLEVVLRADGTAVGAAYGSDSEAEANARLIAAAPDLLDIAQRVVAECTDTFHDPADMSPEWVAIYRDARAAIAKATAQEVRS